MSPVDAELLDYLSNRTTREQPQALAADETFWARLRSAYLRPGDFIHLEYGWYHPAVRAVLQLQIETDRNNQQFASFYKRTEQQQDLERARAAVADLAGVSAEEIILPRNTTEALNIAIQGLPLQSGDEVVHSDQDYISVDEAWEHKAARDGIRLRKVKIPLHPGSDQDILDTFARAITPKTRVLHLTHLIHFTGQVLPVRKLCELGRAHNLINIVDSAHAFAHLDFKVSDFDCDFLAASLHKWLGVPLTLGMLYVRRDRIEAITPLMADTRRPKGDIRKLERFGNRPDAPQLCAIEAIRWHRALTAGTKLARLRFLQQRWASQLATLENVTVLTPAEEPRRGAIGTFSIGGIPAKVVAQRLFEEHRIFVNAIDHPEMDGVRVTPGMPSSTEDLDRLASAIKAIARSR